MLFVKRNSKEKSRLGSRSKEKLFSVHIKLLPTREVFPAKNINNEMKIKDLKALAEYVTGIPYHMQRLHYLDEGDLLDSSEVRSNDIVPGGLLKLNVWNMWLSLVEAAGTGDAEQVFRLGVTQDTDFSTPNSEQMSSTARSAWIADRAFTALFIAAHRGNQKLVDQLLDAGADVNSTTSLGRSPLHVAASQGHGSVVDRLLNRGADINAVDEFGDTALAVASKFNHKGCERQIFLFSWQQRAKVMKPTKEHDLFAHQYFDSAYPVWIKGDTPQIYFSSILPPQEYEGSRINSPLRKPRSCSAPSVSHSLSASGDRQSTHELIESVIDDDCTSRSASGVPGSVKLEKSMPVIEEELFHNRPVRQPTRSRVKSSQSSYDARTAQKALKKGQTKGSRTEKAKEKKSKSYEEWLSKKKSKDKETLAKEEEERQNRKMIEEDKSRQQEYKDKSYDQWLVEKHIVKKKVSQTKPQKQPKTQEGHSPHLIAGGAKTGEEVLRNIMRKRVEEGSDKPPITFDNWTMKKDHELLEQIRAGKTPLQIRLQQGKI